MAEEEGQEVIFVTPVAEWKINDMMGVALKDSCLDTIRGAAYLSGLPKARVACTSMLGPVEFVFDFLRMTQVNLTTGEESGILPPDGLVPPATPCVPPGQTVCIMAPPTSIGKTVRVKYPMATGKWITVRVPDRPFDIPSLSLSSSSRHVDLSYHDWLWLLVPLLGLGGDDGKLPELVGQDTLTEEGSLLEAIEVQIVNPSGNLLGTFRCPVRETVTELKNRLQLVEGVQAQLLHESVVLPDDTTLQLAEIQNGAVLTLFYHDPMLHLLPFQSGTHHPMWVMADIAEAMPGDLILPGVHIPLNNYTGSVIDSDIWNEKGDIGTFSKNVDSIGSEFLVGKCPSRTDTERIVTILQGDPHGVFKSYQDALLSEKCCQKLRGFLDSQCRKRKDTQLTCSWTDLGTLVGESTLVRLADLFSDRVDQIKLRRVEAHGELISFHLDKSKKTMQVMLNDEDEYCGGRLAYLTSQGMQIPNRRRGSATIHDDTILHGVTRMESGVRYSLFLQKLYA